MEICRFRCRLRWGGRCRGLPGGNPTAADRLRLGCLNGGFCSGLGGREIGSVGTCTGISAGAGSGIQAGHCFGLCIFRESREGHSGFSLLPGAGPPDGSLGLRGDGFHCTGFSNTGYGSAGCGSAGCGSLDVGGGACCATGSGKACLGDQGISLGSGLTAGPRGLLGGSVRLRGRCFVVNGRNLFIIHMWQHSCP